MLVTSSAFALVLYAAYPTAPPRLAGLGIADTVTDHAGINLNSELLGQLYNPIAAVPSLHFGYALIVGVTVALLAPHVVVRALGAVYPLVMLFVIIATGNHFWIDAAVGGLVVAVAWLLSQTGASAERRSHAIARRCRLLSRSIASTPSSGPGARNAKAHFQPKSSSKIGISQIVAAVSAKPIASWSASAVPT